MNPPDPPEGRDGPDEYPEINRVRDYLLTTHGRHVTETVVIVLFGTYFALPFGLETIVNVIVELGNSTWLGTTLVLIGGGLSIPIVTVIAHEHVHRLTSEYFGYDVTVTYRLHTCYALIEEQWIDRSHNLVSLAAPFLLISGMSYVLCLVFLSPTLRVVFGYVFFINTIGSCSDIVAFTHLAQRPSGTSSWTATAGDDRRSFIYEPN